MSTINEAFKGGWLPKTVEQICRERDLAPEAPVMPGNPTITKENPQMTTTYVAPSAAAQLAILDGMQLSSAHGLTYGGKPVEPVHLAWFLRGAYGFKFDNDAREGSLIIAAAKLQALSNLQADLSALRSRIDAAALAPPSWIDAGKLLTALFEDVARRGGRHG